MEILTTTLFSLSLSLSLTFPCMLATYNFLGKLEKIVLKAPKGGILVHTQKHLMVIKERRIRAFMLFSLIDLVSTFYVIPYLSHSLSSYFNYIVNMRWSNEDSFYLLLDKNVMVNKSLFSLFCTV